MGYIQMCSKSVAGQRNASFPLGSPAEVFHISLSLTSNLVFAHCRILPHVRLCSVYQRATLTTPFRVVDWFFFLVLDIGNPVVEAIPLGPRFAVGLLQATAVRSAGFSGISLAGLAAGVKSVKLTWSKSFVNKHHTQSSFCHHDVHQCLYVMLLILYRIHSLVAEKIPLL